MEKRAGSLSYYDGFEDNYDAFQQTKKDEKPLYKLKMFQDVGSKVAEEIKLFKTYHPYKKKKKNEDGVDYLINKVEGEIQQNKGHDVNQYQLNQNYQNQPPQQNYQPPEENYQQQQYQSQYDNNQQQPVPQ